MTAFGEISPLTDSDLDLALSWRNADNVRKNMFTSHVITPEEHSNWWSSVKNREDVKYFMFSIEGIKLGILGYTNINRNSKNASWFFYSSPDAPRGTGSKMEFIALDCAFNELDLHKLNCEVISFNQPVIKLHQKFGFAIEGVFRENHRSDGQYFDVLRLGLLSRDWAVKRPELQALMSRRH